MKQEQRREYSLLNQRRLKRYERIFFPVILKILSDQFKEAADLVKRVGPERAITMLRNMSMIPRLGEAIQDIYIQYAIVTGNRVLREINKSVTEVKAGFGFDEKWTGEVIRFFRLYLLNKAVLPVSKETRERLIKVIQDAVTKGWGVDKIAAALRSDDFSMIRARLITRTELSKAEWYGHELAAQESEFEVVTEWIAADDPRTRQSHNEMDGKTHKPGEYFQVPVYKGRTIIGYDTMTGPGDPNGSAGNVINCRCTRATVAARDSKGKIIVKKKIS